jgi:hypothetical protein
MGNALSTNLVIDTEPKLEDIRLLEDRISEFNAQATGIADGKPIGLFLRDNKGAAVGGIYGWTWGATCLRPLRHLRNQGHGSDLNADR